MEGSYQERGGGFWLKNMKIKRHWTKGINVFEKVGDRAKRGPQRKGGLGVVPHKFK